ncbi:hypothetical protein K439DRAFT_1632415 [Ramaria rubella]|nr:hypothetical protein K439DRAFT_1632415 [Ramaria rubella]
MTKEWFMSRCNHVFKTHRLRVMDGHSFRIRGTTWLLLLGVDWQKIERILPDFISDAYHSIHLISTRMSCFVLNL